MLVCLIKVTSTIHSFCYCDQNITCENLLSVAVGLPLLLNVLVHENDVCYFTAIFEALNFNAVFYAITPKCCDLVQGEAMGGCSAIVKNGSKKYHA